MKLTIKTRLILGFGILIAILISLGIYSINSLGSINRMTAELATNWLPSVDYAHSINTHTSDFRILELGHVISEDTAEMESIEKEIDAVNNDILTYIEKYKTVISNDQDRQLINIIEEKWKEYLQLHNEVILLSNDLKTKEAMELLNGASKEVYDTVSNTLLELVKFNQSGSQQASKDSYNVFSVTRGILIIVIIISIFISAGISIIIANGIVRPINNLIGVADKLSLGEVDVNVEVNTKDEIGKLMAAFSRMIQSTRKQAKTAERIAAGDMTVEVEIRSENDLLSKKLYEMVESNNEILNNIASISEQVNAGARQLSDSSIALSQGATEQASSIEELTASIEEISTQTKLNAENADEANKLAEVAKLNAVQGNSQMKEMLTAMEDINVSSNHISKIIKVIDDIAFQTNILALNAAVEAARAGQHGKGFAVVAEEVRTLAARSADAAKETTDMIESSIKKVDSGTKIAKDTANALNEIVYGVEKVANLVGDIAVSSNEQAIGIGQINQGINQVSEVVQTNSATSEESAAASEELSNQASILKEMVSRFTLKKKCKGYNDIDKISPEVLKMLENMSDKNMGDLNKANNKGNLYSYNESEELDKFNSTNEKKIILSDKEFGKY
ncbi:MAG: methyl-accepting chemotaxis protein [Herbinix sp.]|nr:methyl-accepting chemotaxis protein [Herbinix sp.]